MHDTLIHDERLSLSLSLSLCFCFYTFFYLATKLGTASACTHRSMHALRHSYNHTGGGEAELAALTLKNSVLFLHNICRLHFKSKSPCAQYPHYVFILCMMIFNCLEPRALKGTKMKRHQHVLASIKSMFRCAHLVHLS